MYQVWLAPPDLQSPAVELLADMIGLSYVRVVNDLGAFEIGLPFLPHRLLYQLDQRVEIWRIPDGGTSNLELLGFLRKPIYKTDADGKPTVTLVGVDSVEMLRRRIVAYAAGSSYAQKTAAPTDLIEELGRQNFGGLVTDANRNLNAYGVSVLDKTSTAATQSVTCHWQNLLSVVQDICNASRANGREVFFDMVPIAAGTLQLQTWTDWRGIDRRVPLAGAFGLEFGNLAEPELEIDAADEVNYVYVGGEGSGGSRTITQVYDANRTTPSALNRREAFVDGRSNSAPTDTARAALDDGRPRRRFRARLLDTPTSRYGRDWGFGDLVRVAYLGQQFDAHIRSVSVRVDGNGAETIEAQLEAATWLT